MSRTSEEILSTASAGTKVAKSEEPRGGLSLSQLKLNRNWNSIVVFVAVVAVLICCDQVFQVEGALVITPNSKALEEEVHGQLIDFEDGEKRLHWYGVAGDMEDDEYCTKAADGNEHKALDMTVLKKVDYVHHANYPQFTVTALPCQRKINNDMTYLCRANISTCAYAFVASGGGYNLDRKICGLPQV